MRERVGELAAGWRRRGYELGLGAGIAVGYATLGRIGFEGRYDYGALGTRDEPRRAAQRRSGAGSDPTEPAGVRGARGTGRGEARRPDGDEGLRPPGTGVRAQLHPRPPLETRRQNARPERDVGPVPRPSTDRARGYSLRRSAPRTPTSPSRARTRGHRYPTPSSRRWRLGRWVAGIATAHTTSCRSSVNFEHRPPG